MKTMTAFDDVQHPRESATGRFAEKPQSAPELSLGGPEDHATREEWSYYLGRTEENHDRPAVDLFVDRADVAPGLRAFDDYVDHFVGSIEDGHLSRGVAGRGRVAAAAAWAADASAMTQHADDTEISEFRDCVQRGIVALYYEKVRYEGSLDELSGAELEDAARRALAVAEKKRASKAEREFWRARLQHASAAEHRGMLVAAAALSGTDTWWGFRDRPRAVMTGEY